MIERLRRRRQREPATAWGELSIIPLIDVVFFLLVFYVLCTSFADDRALGIERPRSGQAQPVAPGGLLVALTADGAALIGTQRLPATDHAALRTAVAAALDRTSPRVLLVCDARVPSGTLLGVMDACHAAGASDVQVAADQAPP